MAGAGLQSAWTCRVVCNGFLCRVVSCASNALQDARLNQGWTRSSSDAVGSFERSCLGIFKMCAITEGIVRRQAWSSGRAVYEVRVSKGCESAMRPVSGGRSLTCFGLGTGPSAQPPGTRSMSWLRYIHTVHIDVLHMHLPTITMEIWDSP